MALPGAIRMTGPLEEITTRNQIESPLLRLPGELRNRIYELVVGGNIIVVSGRTEQSKKYSAYIVSPGARGNTRTSVSAIFTIGRVSRQLYKETALLQYAKNVFHFNILSDIRPFTDRLSGAQLELLTSISIEIGFVFVYGRKLFSDISNTHIPTTFLPNLERIYARLGTFLSGKGTDALKRAGERLKIDTGRKEGVLLIGLDVFGGMENQDQAKAVKISGGDDAPA